MWVRSQDKTVLIKCNNFSVECYTDSKTNIKSFDIETIESHNGTYTTLGSYSTKAKALKVLDILETFIRGDFVTLLDGNYIKKLRDSFMWGMHDAQQFIREMQNQVLQMPQDSEVE